MEHTIDLDGWWHSRWGMTSDQLRAALSDSNIHDIDRTQYAGDNYAELALDDAEIGGFLFQVVFQMNSGTQGLAKVLMKHELPLGTSQESEVKAVFNTLTKDFGPPEMLDNTSNFRWIFPTTTVQLFTINLPNSLNLVTVIFEPTK